MIVISHDLSNFDHKYVAFLDREIIVEIIDYYLKLDI